MGEYIWLVVSNMFYFPFHIWDVILPIDELIFFKMVEITNQSTFGSATLTFQRDVVSIATYCWPAGHAGRVPVPKFPGRSGRNVEKQPETMPIGVIACCYYTILYICTCICSIDNNICIYIYISIIIFVDTNLAISYKNSTRI